MRNTARNITTIFKREFLAYFNSPIAYIFVIVFLLVNSGLFSANFFLVGRAEMRYFFILLPITLAVFLPAVTMRMWAEERRAGTIALLLSLPVKNFELVIGKFKAAFSFYLIALASTLFIPIAVALAGDPDWGPVICGYLGAVMLGALFLAAGLFISALFKDQILAFIVAMVVCFGLYLAGTDLVAMQLDGWTGGLGTAIKDLFGLAGRLEALERGVIDLSDVLYFIVFTAAFLLLNVYALESRIRMRGARIFPAGVALVLAIAAVISLLTADVRLPRADLTEAGLYTLSDSTRRILSNLKDQALVRYYVTPKDRMPTHWKDMERDVTDLFEEFAQASGGRFKYEVIDPTADVEMVQEKLQKRGITWLQVDTIEEDTREFKKVYSAISISYLDKPEDVIPRIEPEHLGELEYWLISRIYKMTLKTRPKIGFYNPLEYRSPELNEKAMLEYYRRTGQMPKKEDRFNVAKEMLRKQGYDVVDVKLDDKPEIPDDIEVLFVLKPLEMKAPALRKIESFVAKGKNLFVAVQSNFFLYMPAPLGGVSARATRMTPGIKPLLQKFGVTVDNSFLMDESMERIRIPMRRSYGPVIKQEWEPVEQPMQVLVADEYISKDTALTDRLSSLSYMFGTALEIDEKKVAGAGLEAQMLFTSTADSWTVPAKATPLERDDVDPKAHKDRGAKPLAVYLKGRAPGAKGGEKTEVIITGCAEMFSNEFLAWRSNPDFLLNSVEMLVHGETLSGVRSKAGTMKMLGKLSRGEKLLYRFLMLGVMPIVFIALGVTRSLLRRSRRSAYLRKFSQQS